jgi:hypothetical protein
LQRTQDVDDRARHAPETDPNETNRRGINEKKKGEQPCVDVATTSDNAHETIKWSKIV